MATMNIKDPEVTVLARELADRRRTTMTDAVRQALREALVHERARRDGYVERVLTVAERTRADIDRLGVDPLTDEDLYDERGLPR